MLTTLLHALPCLIALPGAPPAVAPPAVLAGRPDRRLTVDEVAFLDIVTIRNSAGQSARALRNDALHTFRQHGVVRIPRSVSRADAAAIVREASECSSRRRHAFGQPSIRDRFTHWLADADGSAVPDSAAALRRALDGEWRGWAAELGAPTVSLAEVVTSLPGGAPQTWHFDGHGVTLQLALCRIGLAEGPTEVRPRAFSESYVDVMTQQAADAGVAADPSHVAALARALAERVGYELTTAAHEAIWAAARPLLRRREAAEALRRGLLPPPPVVRMAAGAGDLTLYDAAMQHRGGANRGATARPILAVHMRRGEGYGPPPA